VSEAKQAIGWETQFGIRAEADLDFIINAGWPVAVSRKAPPELKRRILAAGGSYKLQLRSIDYTLKRYVEADQFERLDSTLGDNVSDFVRERRGLLSQELRKLHTAEPNFGQFGAEVTLFKLPEVVDTARTLANRGLLLEVLPISRLVLELISWSVVAFFSTEEQKVRGLKGQNCISKMTSIYDSVGRLYGYFSTFSHWSHETHSDFIHISERGVTSIIHASPRQRAVSLTLCLVMLDVLAEAIRYIYGRNAEALIIGVQGTLTRDKSKHCHRLAEEIAIATGLQEIKELQEFLR